MDPSPAWVFRNLAESLLMPPANGLLLLLLAALLRRRARWAWGLAIGGVLLIGLSAIKPVAQWVLAPLEREAGLLALVGDRQLPADAGAIVVLGGGMNRYAPEYGRGTVNQATLARLRFAALISRQSGLPLLVAGGSPDGGEIPEAEAMAAVLREWSLEPRWRENRSGDTAESAAFATDLLRPAGVDTVVLVTAASHMARARRSFEVAGLNVIPAPTGFYSREPLTAKDWLPQAEALRNTRLALHEWLGRLWYRWRGT